jgi:hypothetical protein
LENREAKPVLSAPAVQPPEPLAPTTGLPQGGLPRLSLLDVAGDTSLTKISRSVPVPGIERDVQVQVAWRADEWTQAFMLVADSYRARGYETEGPQRFRFTPYHALPDTAVFVAKDAGEVIGTLTLVADNTLLGLPMESIYGPEINELRRAGRHLVEVTSLADKGMGVREFVPVFGTLMRVMAQYGMLHGADTWVITINPRHRAFYQKVMGFVPFGPWRAYPSVQNHPAEAYLLNAPLLKANAPRMYDQLFGEWLPREKLLPARPGAGLMRALARDSSQTDVHTVNRILRHVKRRGGARRW